MPAVTGEVVAKTLGQSTPPPTAPAVGKGPQVAATEPAAPVVPIKAPTEKPQPALASIGFQGGINEFNDRVQKAHDTFVQIHGYEPTPGLVLDIARSSLLPEQFSSLLQPVSTTGLRNQSALTDHLANNPEQHLVARPDGYVQRYSPFAAGEPLGPPVDHPTVQQTLKKYPMIPMGFLPIPDFHGIVDSVQQINKFGQINDSTGQIMVGNLTLSQYEKQADIPPLGSTGGVQSTPDLQAFEKRQMLKDNISKSQDGQKYLQHLAPEFFGDLQATGIWNPNWAKAIQQYQQSNRFARDSLKQLAADNKLSVPDFVNAWNRKQTILKTQPYNAQVVSSLPLVWFAHNGGLGLQTAVDLERYIFDRTHGWGWLNVPNWGLHGLENTVKFGVGLSGGLVNQAVADGAALNAFLQKLAPSVVGEHVSVQSAEKASAKALRANPTLFHLVAPNSKTVQNESGWLKGIDQGATIAAFILSGHPSITGLKIAAGDEVGLARNSWFNFGTRVTYNSLLKKEPIGSAVKGLEGGDAAEQLATVSEPLIQNGSMSLGEFRQHASELYHKGTTTVGDTTIEAGDIFRSLRNKGLPTPGLSQQGWKQISSALRNKLDEFEQGAQAGGLRSQTHAVDLVRNVRTLFARAAPEGQLRSIFAATGGSRTPDDIFNWAVKNLADRTVAHQLRDDFIRARANNDVSAVTKVEDRMRELWQQKNPNASASSGQKPFEPLIASDLPHAIYFPGASLESRAGQINQKLNKFGQFDRQIIVSGAFPAPFPLPVGGGESLGWKHAIADTLRRIAGGGSPFPLVGEARKAKAAVDALIEKRADVRRILTQARLASRDGESRWLARQGTADQKDFTLGVEGATGSAHEDAAGAYLRRHLNDEGLDAYLHSTQGDISPLRGYVLGNKDVRDGILFRKTAYTNDLKKLRATLDPNQPRLFGSGDEEAAALRQQHADEHARAIFDRYREIDESLAKGGQTLEDARAVALKDTEHADQNLGKWLSEHGIALPVRKGLVQDTGWDAPMQWWIGKLMVANKWNRGQLFDHVLYHTYADLAKAGWDPETAIRTSVDLAHAQVRYHMLDFSNMLQAEQNFRWASFFATKHRLYWSWIAKYFIRHPTMSAAVSAIASQPNTTPNAVHNAPLIPLDKNGNFNFPIGGKNYYTPVKRLLWINNRDYPESSAFVQGAVGFAKGLVNGDLHQATDQAFSGVTATNGNILTRDDQAWLLWKRAVTTMAGGHYTFAGATAGMPATQQRQFARDLVEYAIMWQHEHGRKLLPEGDAIKTVLLHSALRETWRANLFVPILESTGRPPAVQKLLNQYYALKTPGDKTAFLAKHPDLSSHFGEQNPDLWWHEQPLWARFNAARAELERQKNIIKDRWLATGQATADDIAQMTKLGQAYRDELLKIQIDDSRSWPGASAVQDGGVWQIKNPGPWTKQLLGDPGAAKAFIHETLPGIQKAELDKTTIGDRVIALQNWAAILKQIKTDDQAKQWGQLTLKSAQNALANVNQQLSVYFSYPSSPSSKAESAYYSQHVGPYITERERRFAEIKTLPSADRNAAYAQFAAWRDSHDHPVKIVVDGKTVTFPSPVKVGYLDKPEPLRVQMLAHIYGMSGWMGLSDYEKSLMGMPTSPGVSDGYAALLSLERAYREDPTTATSQLAKSQVIKAVKAIDKGVPTPLPGYPDGIKPHPGLFKAYVYGMQHSRFEIWKSSGLFTQMPTGAQQQFEELIAPVASVAGKAIVSGTYPRSYVAKWHIYVKDNIMPQLSSPQYKPLRDALAPYGPNFLDNLVLPGNG